MLYGHEDSQDQNVEQQTGVKRENGVAHTAGGVLLCQPHSAASLLAVPHVALFVNTDVVYR